MKTRNYITSVGLDNPLTPSHHAILGPYVGRELPSGLIGMSRVHKWGCAMRAYGTVMATKKTLFVSTLMQKYLTSS